jgi:hypothetical protein
LRLLPVAQQDLTRIGITDLVGEGCSMFDPNSRNLPAATEARTESRGSEIAESKRQKSQPPLTR